MGGWTQDQLIRESHSYLLREVLNAQFVELHGAGHGLVSEAGDELFPALYKHFELSALITEPTRHSAASAAASDFSSEASAFASSSAAASAAASSESGGSDLHPTYRGHRSDQWLHALNLGCKHKSSCTALSLKAAFVVRCVLLWWWCVCGDEVC